MNKLTALFLICIVCFSVLSCKKDKDTIEDPVNLVETRSYTNKIILNDLVYKGDSVRLSWTILDTASFKQYLVIRKEVKSSASTPVTYVPVTSSNYSSSEIIGVINDRNTNYFVDKDIPYSPYVEYQLVGILSSTITGSNYTTYKNVISNVKTIERPEIKVLQMKPHDVLPDLQNNLLYIIEKDSGRISVLNFETGLITRTVNVNAVIGYCALADYNGQRELYVPRNDGWVFIYDAQTLNKKDQVNTGAASSCVAFSNNKLYVSTADRYWPNRPLKVIDRGTKSLITMAGSYENTRFKVIPGTNTELIEVTTNISPVNLRYLSFNYFGIKMSEFEDRYHGDYPLSHQVFQVHPNGQEFITSSEGAIYSKDLVYKLRLPHGNYQYSDFAFNASGSVIYASCSNEKRIISYSNPGYSELKTYTTKCYPFAIFRKDNMMICLSSTSKFTSSSYYNYNPANKFIIEKIAID